MRPRFAFSLDEIGLAPIKDVSPEHDGLGWAHGGIVLPDSDAIGPSGTDSQSLMLGMICLRGPLRPDATVSRDSIRAVPFSVHSATQLAVRLAAGGLDAPAAALEQIATASLIGIPPRETCSTVVIGGERLISSGAWNDEAVISVGGGLISVNELRTADSAVAAIPLRIAGPRMWNPDRDAGFEFYTFLELGLLQLFCEVTFERLDDVRGGLYATGRAATVQVSDILPPLYAVPFPNLPSSVARAPIPHPHPMNIDLPGSCLNAVHPLARWVSGNAERLARDFAAPFNRVLRRAPWVRDPDEINEALGRVANARTDIPAPPHTAYVRADENGWWVSR